MPFINPLSIQAMLVGRMVELYRPQCVPTVFCHSCVCVCVCVCRERGGREAEIAERQRWNERENERITRSVNGGCLSSIRHAWSLHLLPLFSSHAPAPVHVHMLLTSILSCTESKRANGNMLKCASPIVVANKNVGYIKMGCTTLRMTSLAVSLLDLVTMAMTCTTNPVVGQLIVCVHSLCMYVLSYVDGISQ